MTMRGGLRPRVSKTLVEIVGAKGLKVNLQRGEFLQRVASSMFTADEIRDLPPVISGPRFATYLRVTNNDVDHALALYHWLEKQRRCRLGGQDSGGDGAYFKQALTRCHVFPTLLLAQSMMITAKRPTAPNLVYADFLPVSISRFGFEIPLPILHQHAPLQERIPSPVGVCGLVLDLIGKYMLDDRKAGQCLGFGSVTARLKAIQPILDIAGSPSNLARANVAGAGAGKAAVAGAAVKGGARFKAGDVEHVHDSQKLVSIRGHEGVLSIGWNAGRGSGRRWKLFSSPFTGIHAWAIGADNC